MVNERKGLAGRKDAGPPASIDNYGYDDYRGSPVKGVQAASHGPAHGIDPSAARVKGTGGR